MTGFDIIDTIQRLRAEERPFCVATVVRTADLTSAKAGAKAVITAEGEILGQLGGGCVKRAVRTTAAEVLESGEAQMISVRPADDAAPADAGVEVHASGCPSGGTADIFIEPYHPPLRLFVVGETPIAQAVEAHAALMGFRVERSAELATRTATTKVADLVVIAAQGAGDIGALRAAIDNRAGYIAVVASHRKADFLKQKLTAEGVDPNRLKNVHSPAGLDLGAIDPHEIAVSILAHIIQWRRAAQSPPGVRGQRP